MQTIRKDKKGQLIMINLLILAMTVLVLVAIVPIFQEVLGIAKQSNYLNCPGYDYDRSGTLGDHMWDYNSTISGSTDRLACIAIGMYVPYLVLAILIGSIMRALSGQLMESGPTQNYYGG